jgi:hypothetical protein
MKFNRLFGSVLISCILLLNFGQCPAQQYSIEFQALLNQIQQNYLAQKVNNLSSLRNKYPTVVATLIGHALRQQMIYVQKDPSLNSIFIELQQQAQAYIGEVARTTSARVHDGSQFTSEILWILVNGALQGQDDDWILQNYGVRTGTIPSVLAVSSVPQPPTAISAAPSLQINRIDLKPPVVAAGRTFDLVVDFSVSDPSAANDQLPVLFSLSILEGSKVLYAPKATEIKSYNSKSTLRTEPLKAADKKGIYTIKVSVKYKTLAAEKSVELRIE